MGENPEGSGQNGRLPGVSIRFQADADLNLDIVMAVLQKEPGVDFASASDSKLRGLKDPEVLKRAAEANRVLVSQDRNTMLNHFRNYLASGMSSPGLLVVSRIVPVGPIVEAILILWSSSGPSEVRDQAYYLPSLARHVFTR